MRRKCLACLLVGLPGGLLLGAILLATVNVEARLGLAPGSLRPVRTDVDLRAVHRGVVAWRGVYESTLPLSDTWHDYPRLAVMELEEGARSTDPCLRLSQVELFYQAGRQTSVRLCALKNGTRIYLYQRLYWRPRSEP
jgi:hypothetical protein